MDMLALPVLLLLGGFHVDYATYLGGSQDEQTPKIAVDSGGNAYVAGTSNSADFPVTTGGLSGTPCAFVTKLTPGGSSIVWSRCLEALRADAIALDGSGNVYLLAHNQTNLSSIVKLSPDGAQILYSQPLGTFANAITVDSAGNAYAVGSASQGVPTTQGAYQPSPTPGSCHYGAGVGMIPINCADAFAIKLSPDGSTVYATYLGGSHPDEARAAAVDAQGNLWITGDTASPDFPVTSGALQSVFHGEVDLGPLWFGDAFVAKLNATGSKLLYSTYLGGAAPDAGMAIVVDGAGAAYVAGGTQSADFPTTPGALSRTYSGPSNSIPALSGQAFVAKLSVAGALVYSTFASGGQANGIALDASGQIYFTSGSVSVLSADGSSIVHTGNLPGSMAVDPQGGVYLVDTTLGYLFFPTAGVAQAKFGGGVYDASVVKMDFAGPASVWVSSIVNAASMRTGTPQFYPVFDVAPGEIVSVFGSGFDATTRLLFDGVAAPIFYAGSGQVNAVVPFGVAGPTTAVTLEGGGQTFGPGRMNVFDAVPGIFTLDGSGKGQAAVLNQDGTINSAANPALRGSVISVFMTGAGRMMRAQADGSVTALVPPFPTPALGVSSPFGQILYAGGAPGLVAGAVQVNIQVPGSAIPGDHVPLLVYVGNYASGFSGDTTVAIR